MHLTDARQVKGQREQGGIHNAPVLRVTECTMEQNMNNLCHSGTSVKMN